MDELDDIYRSESLETLDDIEAALLALEERQSDSELIRRVFRGMHTIKGSGAMFGFTNISQFAHQIETVFERIRNGELAITHELMDLTLLSCDLIRAMLADVAMADASLPVRAAALGAEISGVLAGTQAAAVAVLPLTGYRLRIRLLIDKGERNDLPILSREKLSQLGEYSFLRLSEMIDSAADYQSCDILLRSVRELAAVREGVMASEFLAGAGPANMVGELYLAAEEAGVECTPDWWAAWPPLGMILVEDAIAEQWLVDTALAAPPAARPECQLSSSAFFAVDKVNLDRMVDLVGNLAAVQEKMTGRLVGVGDGQLAAMDREMSGLVDELRRTTMRILWHLG